MALKITDLCINCGACAPECPNNAIYEGGTPWSWDGTRSSTGVNDLPTRTSTPQKALSDDIYYIVPDKCTECIGFYGEPQCAVVCPVACCVPDSDHKRDTSTQN